MSNENPTEPPAPSEPTTADEGLSQVRDALIACWGASRSLTKTELTIGVSLYGGITTIPKFVPTSDAGLHLLGLNARMLIACAEAWLECPANYWAPYFDMTRRRMTFAPVPWLSEMVREGVISGAAVQGL